MQDQVIRPKATVLDEAPTRSYRVLMIAPTSFFADYGCHVRILEEARVLQKLGHRVTICTYYTGRNLPDLDIRRTLSIPWRRDYEVGSSRHKIAFDMLLSWRALQTMAQVKPDIIHAHLHEGALIGKVLSKLWGVPLVFDFQGSMTSEMVDHRFLSPNGPTFPAWRRLEEWIDHLAPFILTSSAQAVDLLVNEFRCPRDKIRNVPDGVNTDFFAPRPRDEDWHQLKRAWGIPRERQVVIYLGLLAEYQGISHLLQAARLLAERRDDVHWVIGGYPQVEYYRQMAGELGLAERVTFLGKVPYEDAPRILSLGDIAVSPKLSKTEGAGKLLNYMAMALPTVTFDTDVSREYLAEYGLYAARGESADLARCIETLLDQPQRRAELGAALRRRAQECFAWELAGKKILEVYAAMTR